jgi:hypothetical protein
MSIPYIFYAQCRLVLEIKRKTIPLHAKQELRRRGGIAPILIFDHGVSGQRLALVKLSPRNALFVLIELENVWASEVVWTQRSLPGIEPQSSNLYYVTVLTELPQLL